MAVCWLLDQSGSCLLSTAFRVLGSCQPAHTNSRIIRRDDSSTAASTSAGQHELRNGCDQVDELSQLVEELTIDFHNVAGAVKRTRKLPPICLPYFLVRLTAAYCKAICRVS